MAPVPVQLSPAAAAQWQQRLKDMNGGPRRKEHDGPSPLPQTIITDDNGNETSRFSHRELKLSSMSQTYRDIEKWLREDTLAKKASIAELTTLKYTKQIIPEGSDGSGSPLYIALHGGGNTSTNENNEEWAQMQSFYHGQLTKGVYIAVRGLGDDWNLHFTTAMYVLIERLIENMIMFQNVDANKVYLLGFSAGGDGVYRLAAHLSQRFAAANAGGGHPGDVKFDNLMNMPICLQVGEQDKSWGRCQLVGQTAVALDGLSSSNGGEPGTYAHQVFIHRNGLDDGTDDGYIKVHWKWEEPFATLSKPDTDGKTVSNVVVDYKAWSKANPVPNLVNGDDGRDETVNAAPDSNIRSIDTNAIVWLNKHDRRGDTSQHVYLPQHVYWRLNNISGNDNWTEGVGLNTAGRGDDAAGRSQNYWLDIGQSTSKDVGEVIDASLNKADNSIRVNSAKKYLRFLLKDGMLDLTKQVIVKFKQFPQKSLSIQVDRDNPTVIRETLSRNDPNLIFTSDVIIEDPNNNGNWTIRKTAR